MADVPATTPDTPTPAKSSRSIPLPKVKANPNVNRDHTLVIFAMVGTAGVLIVSDIHAGKFPSARQLVGLGFVFAAIAGLTAVAPAIAVPFALLVFFGVLLNKGLGFFSGIGIASSSKTALTGTPQPGTSGVPQSYMAGDTPTDAASRYDQTPSPKAERAVRFALAAIGTPYIYGGMSSNGYDCSGLMVASYLVAGIHLPRTSEAQYNAGYHAVPWGEWAPGDLIFSQWPGDGTAPGHVVMYVGNGVCVAAPHTGATVEKEPVATFAKPHYWGSVRPAPLQDPHGLAHRHR